MPGITAKGLQEGSSHAYTPLPEGESADVGDGAPQKPYRAPSTIVQSVLPFGAGVIVTIIFFLFSPYCSGCSKSCQTQPNILRTPVPELPLTVVEFKSNRTYEARPSIKTNHAWNALLPPGRGFVFVDNPKQYHLKPGQETKHGQIYSVSLFHQLHCLGELRKAHWTLIEGVETGDTRPSKKLLGEGGVHIAHCLDYLRQGIMCAGDMSLEWPRTEPDGDRFAVDGWGIPHQCKSWDAISEYMEKNHLNSSINADIAPG